MGGMRIDGTILQQEFLPDDFMRHWMSNFTTILTYIKVSPPAVQRQDLLALVTAPLQRGIDFWLRHASEDKHLLRPDLEQGKALCCMSPAFSQVLIGGAAHRLSPCGLCCKGSCHSAGAGA